MAGSQAVTAIRRLSHLDEFRQVVALQREIWRFADIEVIPVRFLVVAAEVGGQVFGAFDDGNRAIGFCLAIPGLRADGLPFLHSHMLGVVPECRDRGVGRALKLRQREDALAGGITLVEWTFDPLELKNAYLNLGRLGAIVRRYSENLYGPTGSPLHGGLPTDRCHAEWWLDSPRVRAALAGHAAGAIACERVSLPADIGRLRAEDPARAREIQRGAAARLQGAFSRGLAATGFERTGAGGAYLLEPWQ